MSDLHKITRDESAHISSSNNISSKRKRSEVKNGDEEEETKESKKVCGDNENNIIKDWENKYNNFEVYCCPGEKYDFSSIEYNNVIDGELRDLKVNTPYPITNIQHHMKKYDIDTDRIDEVIIISLQTENGLFRIVAPYALTEYWDMIEDKLYHDTTLVIFRKEKELIHVFVQ